MKWKFVNESDARTAMGGGRGCIVLTMELYLDKPKFTVDETKDGDRFVKIAVPMATAVPSLESAQRRMEQFWDLIGRRLIVHLQEKGESQRDWVTEQQEQAVADTRIAVLEAKLREWEYVGLNVELLLKIATADPQVPLDAVQREGCVLDVNALRRLADQVERARTYAEPEPMENDEPAPSNEDGKQEVLSLPIAGDTIWTPDGEALVVEVLYGTNGEEPQVEVASGEGEESTRHYLLSEITREPPSSILPESCTYRLDGLCQVDGWPDGLLCPHLEGAVATDEGQECTAAVCTEFCRHLTTTPGGGVADEEAAEPPECEHRTGDMECTLDEALEYPSRLADGTCSPPVEGEGSGEAEEEASRYQSPNEHGVFTEYETIEIYRTKKEVCEVHLAEAGPQDWRMNFDMKVDGAGDGCGGSGGLPSLSGESYSTRDAALQAAVESARDSCERRFETAAAKRWKKVAKAIKNFHESYPTDERDERTASSDEQSSAAQQQEVV